MRLVRRLFAARTARQLERAFPGRLGALEHADPDVIWAQLAALRSPTVRLVEVSLSARRAALDAYWVAHRRAYRGWAAREKAVEHALTFELLDFARVERSCDIASCESRLGDALSARYPHVEHWRQDLAYRTQLARRRLGGPAQDLREIADGTFDALTLHCSFEHFEGDADSAWVREVARVLSPRGACLIVPLYLSDRHIIRFDPAGTSIERLARYDRAAGLVALPGSWEQHCRFYSPASLAERVLAQLPAGLRATLLRFRDGAAIDPGVYLAHGLVLHRADSVLTI